MNIKELNDIIEKEAGVNICPICGTPFEKFHYRQITCGTDECRKSQRAKYMREYTEKQKAEDIEAYRKKNAERERRYRRKKKGLDILDENLKRAQEYWERQEAKRFLEKDDGKTYAQRQVEKTLASVPKIDVNINGKERKK